MATYVLLHGGWAGGWQWRAVASRLRTAGHEVFRPTFTGLGERLHLASPAVGLETHVRDVLGVVEYEQLHDVILVGFSYSGMVVTAVAERAPDRLAHLVYLDAFIPEDGEALRDLWDAATWQELEERACVAGESWQVPPYPPSTPFPGGVRPPGSPHPLKSLMDRVRLGHPAAAAVPRTVILCTGKDERGLYAPINWAAARARAAGWRYRELPTVHAAMWTMPDEVTSLLLELA